MGFAAAVRVGRVLALMLWSITVVSRASDSDRFAVKMQLNNAVLNLRNEMREWRNHEQRVLSGLDERDKVKQSSDDSEGRCDDHSIAGMRSLSEALMRDDIRMKQEFRDQRMRELQELVTQMGEINPDYSKRKNTNNEEIKAEMKSVKQRIIKGIKEIRESYNCEDYQRSLESMRKRMIDANKQDRKLSWIKSKRERMMQTSKDELRVLKGIMPHWEKAEYRYLRLVSQMATNQQNHRDRYPCLDQMCEKQSYRRDLLRDLESCVIEMSKKDWMMVMDEHQYLSQSRRIDGLIQEIKQLKPSKPHCLIGMDFTF